jgi:WD40 repeat protein
VTSFPDVTTAIGTPFHDATAPLTTTGPAALTGLRLSRAVAAEGDAGTAPPKYNGLMTSASAGGTPVAVKGGGVGTTVVVGAAGVFLAILGAEEHPLKARAATNAVASPTERARPAGGREMGNMSLPYGLPPRVQRTRAGCASRRGAQLASGASGVLTVSWILLSGTSSSGERGVPTNVNASSFSAPSVSTTTISPALISP